VTVIVDSVPSASGTITRCAAVVSVSAFTEEYVIRGVSSDSG
jgi:hypothetical protein